MGTSELPLRRSRAEKEGNANYNKALEQLLGIITCIGESYIKFPIAMQYHHVENFITINLEIAGIINWNKNVFLTVMTFNDPTYGQSPTLWGIMVAHTYVNRGDFCDIFL